MKIFWILLVFVLTDKSPATAPESCESFYKEQLSNKLMDGKVEILEETEEYYLVQIMETENEQQVTIELLKNKMGKRIFVSISKGDRILKNRKDFIGLAIFKYDSDNQISQIITYDELCLP